MKDWYVYMLRCSDSRIYVGVTVDPTRRWWEHNNSSKGARFTAGRRPNTPIWVAKVVDGDRSKAQKVEYWLKKKIRVWQKRKIARGDYNDATLSELGCPALVVSHKIEDFGPSDGDE